MRKLLVRLLVGAVIGVLLLVGGYVVAVVLLLLAGAKWVGW